MPSGFQAFKDDGSLLFDADLIQYGLIKSGYLTQSTWWPWWVLRSAQLPSGEEGSWREENAPFATPIWEISVTGATSPICFIAGEHSEGGTTVSGATTTFYFSSVRGNPKVYIFDLMRDLGGKVGMQLFDANGKLTFTTDMPGLNIISTVTASPSTGLVSYGGVNYHTKPYGEGGIGEVVGYYVDQAREQIKRQWYHTYSATQNKNGATEVAARLTYSRSFGYTASNIGSCSALDACAGGTNPRFFAVQSPVTTNGFQSTGDYLWANIPQDRFPDMQMIDTSHYPFPFR